MWRRESVGVVEGVVESGVWGEGVGGGGRW